MNLRHLQFFVQLAKTEHMAKAAEILDISQPSLSYAINSLEEELGVPLFEKDGRNIKLTNYGQIFLQYVQKSLDELNQGAEYINELLDINRGHINLGFTFTMGQDLVPRLVREFQKNEDHQKISFSFLQGTTTELVEQLLDDKLDLVLASQPTLPKQKEQISLYHLVDQEIMAAVPLEYPFKSGETIALSELKDYPFILYSQKSGLKDDIDRLLKRAHVNPQVKLESIEDHTIIGFVHWNYGVALTPNLPQLDSNQVKLLHLSDKENWHKLYVITKNNHFMTPSITLFQEFVEDYCKKHYLDQNKLI